MNPDSIVNNLVTARDYVRYGISRFTEAQLYFGHGTAGALDEAAALVLHALHLPYDIPGGYLDGKLTPEERLKIIGLIERRINERQPLAYLTHEAPFAGLSFYVDERVLVPRSPIAELIESEFSPWLDGHEVRNILDLCTGSGCIAIACAHAFPEAKVDAVDISRDALDVTNININAHGLVGRVNPVESDLFNNLEPERYDLIVSNPPYVNLTEWQGLAPEYHSEPKLGLVAENDGLHIVHRILKEAPNFLTPEGILIVEVGSAEQALKAFYPDIPFCWLEFERGGEGVFLLTAEMLLDEHEVILDCQAVLSGS